MYANVPRGGCSEAAPRVRRRSQILSTHIHCTLRAHRAALGAHLRAASTAHTCLLTSCADWANTIENGLRLQVRTKTKRDLRTDKVSGSGINVPSSLQHLISRYLIIAIIYKNNLCIKSGRHLPVPISRNRWKPKGSSKSFQLAGRYFHP